MTIDELVSALRNYPGEMPVKVYCADGTVQEIIAIEDDDDSPDIMPLTVFVVSEERLIERHA